MDNNKHKTTIKNKTLEASTKSGVQIKQKQHHHEPWLEDKTGPKPNLEKERTKAAIGGPLTQQKSGQGKDTLASGIVVAIIRVTLVMRRRP